MPSAYCSACRSRRTSGPSRADMGPANRPAGHATTGWPAVNGVGADSEGTDKDVDDAAVAAYWARSDAGKPLSERILAQMFGKTSRRWARNRMVEATGRAVG
ncbi:MAG: hypothetical protein ACRDPY_15115 [Streptosporangiaceae bacterium]